MVESHPWGGAADSGTGDDDKDVPLYQNREWVVENYVESDKPVKEIAKEAGCARITFYEWLNRLDVPRRRSGRYGDTSNAKYRDEEWLREKYVDERLSTAEIADICDCSKETIGRWLGRHGIEARGRSESAKVSWIGAEDRKREVAERFRKIHSTIHPFFFTDVNGYERVGSSDGAGGSVFVKVHALTAIAHGADPYEIFSTEKVVHHESKIPWDNRPDNLKVLTPSEHSRLHANELWGNDE